MKKFFTITNAVVLKAAALFLLSALTLFNGTLKVFTWIFRFVAIPVSVFGLLITGVTYLDNGYSPSLLNALGIFIGIIALYYLLPLVPAAIDRTQLRMKNYIYSPITVRSPVKFTL